MAEQFRTRQCADCGKVVQTIWTGRATVLVEDETEEFYAMRRGPDRGYTSGGTMLEGHYVKPGCGFEGTHRVHRLHNCHRK